MKERGEYFGASKKGYPKVEMPTWMNTHSENGDSMFFYDDEL